PLLRLRTHPTPPRMPPIGKESAAAKARVEPLAGIDLNLVDHRLLLLAEKREGEVLRLRTHPRRLRKPRPQLLETLIERTEDLRRKTRSDEQPHYWTSGVYREVWSAAACRRFQSGAEAPHSKTTARILDPRSSSFFSPMP